MIDELRAISIFAEVARKGSFRAASRSLQLSPSVVSYHINQLETRLGSALIYRSTRKLSLTHEGQVLYQYALKMIAAAQQGLSEVIAENPVPVGRLTVTLPTALTQAPVTRKIAGFVQRFPGIEMQIRFTDTRLDLVENGIDLAIRVGEMEDSTLKSRRLGAVLRKLVCTPDYLATRHTPKDPRELKSWDWIRLTMLPDTRRFRKDKKSRQVKMKTHVSVDSVEAMTQLCLHGLGLATPPDYLVSNAITNGELIEVLPEWRVELIPIYAVWHGNAAHNSNIRRLLDFLFAD